MGNKWVQNHLLTIDYYLLNHILPYIYHYLQYIFNYIRLLFCLLWCFFVLINVHPLKALQNCACFRPWPPRNGGRKKRPDEATGPRKLVNGKQYNGSYNKWDSKDWLVVFEPLRYSPIPTEFGHPLLLDIGYVFSVRLWTLCCAEIPLVVEQPWFGGISGNRSNKPTKEPVMFAGSRPIL